MNAHREHVQAIQRYLGGLAILKRELDPVADRAHELMNACVASVGDNPSAPPLSVEIYQTAAQLEGELDALATLVGQLQGRVHLFLERIVTYGA